MQRQWRRSALAGLAMALLLGGCGNERLSEALGTINKEYGALQDQALLINILRRSLRLPAHFTTLTTVRGRNRVNAGASMSLPFGAEAPSRFEFNPNVSVEQGPTFEVSTQANKEFYQGYLAPVGVTTTHFYLRQDQPPELILSLMVERIRLREAGGQERLYVNSPDQPASYAEFQALLERLVDEGLTTEEVQLQRDVGPEFRSDSPVGLSQILSAHEKGLVVDDLTGTPPRGQAGQGPRRYRLRSLTASARFCFRRPTSALFAQGRCRSGAVEERRYAVGDRSFFGAPTGALAVLDGGSLGVLELHLRSLAEIMDYLGEAAQMQLEKGHPPPEIRTAGGREALLAVKRGPAGGPGISVVFHGESFTVPAGPAGGQSGSVFAIISQLLAQAQSVRNIPTTNAVTILGD
ncbi:hypothetical protein J8J14_19360 [Roseomonas sp. SSH11]|uniref:Uncharacterized protein n=1 Tax=Pararoseomonas baculiformis TaxID=2820812 RepID=A0ABS4AIT4_9PROT|nr:hypothetical protein [Pararoseomonas baculiformis]MBP0446938.1 hypothetical protein [Pararoseomonas baculiformis]